MACLGRRADQGTEIQIAAIIGHRSRPDIHGRGGAWLLGRAFVAQASRPRRASPLTADAPYPYSIPHMRWDLPLRTGQLLDGPDPNKQHILAPRSIKARSHPMGCGFPAHRS